MTFLSLYNIINNLNNKKMKCKKEHVFHQEKIKNKSNIIESKATRNIAYSVDSNTGKKHYIIYHLYFLTIIIISLISEISTLDSIVEQSISTLNKKKDSSSAYYLSYSLQNSDIYKQTFNNSTSQKILNYTYEGNSDIFTYSNDSISSYDDIYLSLGKESNQIMLNKINFAYENRNGKQLDNLLTESDVLNIFVDISSQIRPSDFYSFGIINNNNTNGKVGGCTYSNFGFSYNKFVYSQREIKDLINYGQVSIVVFEDKAGLYTLIYQQDSIIVYSLDEYIKKVKEAIPDAPNLGINSTEFNFERLFLTGDPNLFNSANTYFSTKDSKKNNLIAQTNTALVIYNITVSSELSSIIYLQYSSSVYDFTKYIDITSTINQIDVYSNYLIICSSANIIFLEKVIDINNQASSWKLHQEFELSCVDIKIYSDTMYTVIKERGLFIFNLLNMEFINPYNNYLQLSPVLTHSRIIKIELLNKLNTKDSSSNNEEIDSEITTNNQVMLGILIQNEPSNRQNEFFIELDLREELYPKIFRIFTYENKISANYFSTDISLISYIYDRNSNSLIIIPRGVNTYAQSLSYIIDLPFDYQKSAYWEISLLYNYDFTTTLLLNGQDSILFLTEFIQRDSNLKCQFYNKGEYYLSLVKYYDCSKYISVLGRVRNDYCSYKLENKYIVNFGSEYRFWWYVLGGIGLLIVGVVVFIIIYKYNCFIRKKQESKIKPRKFYNDPKYLGIDVNEINVWDNDVNNDGGNNFKIVDNENGNNLIENKISNNNVNSAVNFNLSDFHNLDNNINHINKLNNNVINNTFFIKNNSNIDNNNFNKLYNNRETELNIISKRDDIDSDFLNNNLYQDVKIKNTHNKRELNDSRNNLNEESNIETKNAFIPNAILSRNRNRFFKSNKNDNMIAHTNDKTNETKLFNNEKKLETLNNNELCSCDFNLPDEENDINIKNSEDNDNKFYNHQYHEEEVNNDIMEMKNKDTSKNIIEESKIASSNPLILLNNSKNNQSNAKYSLKIFPIQKEDDINTKINLNNQNNLIFRNSNNKNVNNALDIDNNPQYYYFKEKSNVNENEGPLKNNDNVINQEYEANNLNNDNGGYYNTHSEIDKQHSVIQPGGKDEAHSLLKQTPYVDNSIKRSKNELMKGFEINNSDTIEENNNYLKQQFNEFRNKDKINTEANENLEDKYENSEIDDEHKSKHSIQENEDNICNIGNNSEIGIKEIAIYNNYDNKDKNDIGYNDKVISKTNKLPPLKNKNFNNNKDITINEKIQKANGSASLDKEKGIEESVIVDDVDYLY